MTIETSSISLSLILEATKGSIAASVEDAYVTSVTTDSRDVKPGMLFVALRGENFDGNDYVRSAIEKGASYALAG